MKKGTIRRIVFIGEYENFPYDKKPNICTSHNLSEESKVYLIDHKGCKASCYIFDPNGLLFRCHCDYSNEVAEFEDKYE